MKPLINMLVKSTILTLALGASFSFAQQHRPGNSTPSSNGDLSDKVRQLERLIEKQEASIRNLDNRVRRLESLPPAVIPPAPPHHTPYPSYPNSNEACTITYGGSFCSNNSINKYVIEANGKAMSECMYSLDNAINSFNNFKASGLCASNDYYAPQCQVAYNSSACSNNSINKYSIESNGRVLSECTYSQDNALNMLKKLRESKICY